MKTERWRQVDALLQSALERPPAERAAFLERACGTDVSLKREVESLILSADEAASFIEQPALESEKNETESANATLVAGRVFGDYKVVRQLGAGGMGEVYLAADTRTGREVALKLLHDRLTNDEQHVQRFRQEARAVLALNHPNVVTIYEIGQAEGLHYIATEFIEGETLRARLGRLRRLEIGDALEIAAQVTGALAYAHERGVVHRDIKPENVMLRPDGYVKVLDFGIAKLTERSATVTSGDEAPTRVKVNTSPGMVMGTAHYMSPEQTRGVPVDERTDIWSLGVVLYEMVTGRQPFDAETVSDIISLILQRDPPPLSQFLAEVPGDLERILEKALDKRADERYQTAKDLLADLRRLKRRHEHEQDISRSTSPEESRYASSSGVQEAQSAAITAAETGRIGSPRQTSSAEYVVSQIKGHKKSVAVALTVVVMAVATLAWLGYRFLSRNRSQPPASLQAMKIMPMTDSGKARDAVVSPDGRLIAYVLEDGEHQSVQLRQVVEPGEREIVPALPNTNIKSLSFSPDGNYLCYLVGAGLGVRDLYRVPLIGGVSRRLNHDVDSAVTFAPDGKQFAFVRHNGSTNDELLIVSDADGSNERQIAVHHSPEIVENPAWSPDGQTVAYTLSSIDKDGYYTNLAEIRIADSRVRLISIARWRSIQGVSWLPEKRSLLAAARDRASSPSSPTQIWEISYPNGEARKLTNDLNQYFSLSLSADGKVLMTTNSEWRANIWILPAGDAARARQLTTGKENGSFGLSWMPDGRLVYTSVASGYGDLWIINADGSERRQLTFGTDANHEPAASPDGRYIVFMTNRRVGWSIWRMNADGSGLKELVPNIDQQAIPQVSPDSQWVFYSSREPSGKRVMWRVSIDGGTPAQLTTKDTSQAALSADGLRVTYEYRDPPGSPAKIETADLVSGQVLQTFERPQDFLGWNLSADGRSITCARGSDTVANIWIVPLDGGKAKQLTDWKSETIFWISWSRDSKNLAVSRGSISNDVVLIKDFR